MYVGFFFIINGAYTLNSYSSSVKKYKSYRNKAAVDVIIIETHPKVTMKVIQMRLIQMRLIQMRLIQMRLIKMRLVQMRLSCKSFCPK
jgi:hypothetical protein